MSRQKTLNAYAAIMHIIATTATFWGGDIFITLICALVRCPLLE